MVTKTASSKSSASAKSPAKPRAAKPKAEPAEPKAEPTFEEKAAAFKEAVDQELATNPPRTGSLLTIRAGLLEFAPDPVEVQNWE